MKKVFIALVLVLFLISGFILSCGGGGGGNGNVSENEQLSPPTQTGSFVTELPVGSISNYNPGTLETASLFRNFLVKKAYAEDVIVQLPSLANNTSLMNRVLDIHNDVFSIKAIREEKSISVGKLDSQLRALKERKAYTAETIRNISLSVEEIISLDKNGIECLYCNNELHLLQS